MKQKLFKSIVDVPLTDIVVSKANTRRYYDPDALNDLANSLGSIGQIYPVVLRRVNASKYELMIGSRRLRAQETIKALTIPAFIIDEIDDEDMVILALAENLHRKDLNPFEEAWGFLSLCKDKGMSHQQVAKRVGKDCDFVTNRLKLLSLPDEVQDMLCSDSGVRLCHVNVLASLKQPRDQIRYAKIVAQQKLTQENLITLIQDEVRPARFQNERRLFTNKSIALKVKRFDTFLTRRVRPQLVIGGEDAIEIRSELRRVRRTIDGLLGRSKLQESI